MVARRIWLSLLLGVLATPAVLFAHATGEDYVFFRFEESRITGLFEVHFDDLRDKLDLEIRGTEEEALGMIESNAARVEQYILENFSVGPAKAVRAVHDRVHRPAVEVLPKGTFAQYHFEIARGPLPDQLGHHHSMFYDGDKLHRGLVLVE